MSQQTLRIGFDTHKISVAPFEWITRCSLLSISISEQSFRMKINFGFTSAYSCRKNRKSSSGIGADYEV